MRSPADMTIIEIELTNACVHCCSNCTRMCGHHRKPFFITWDHFTRAVASLEGFNGMAGLMGGEPTLHPQFEKFARYLAENYGVKETLERGRLPIRSFSEYISRELLKTKKRGRCLCSSLGNTYYKHFEVIQETFHYQLLNDHQHSGNHQGILISRKDLGIPDDEWFTIRDACWLQNNWSASITPKGAFFCEVAAALDMLFDGPGGWPIEPGWWKRKPEDFGDQLKWCEICGIALKGPLTTAKSGLDDISPSVLKKLEAMGSPKVKAGQYKIFDPLKIEHGKSEYTPGKPFYLPEGQSTRRIESNNMSLFPRNIYGIMLCDSIETLASDELTSALSQLDGLCLVSETEPSDAVRTLLEDRGIVCHVGKEPDLRRIISSWMEKEKMLDWITVFNQHTAFSPEWRKRMGCTVFNPGCLYVCNPVNHLGGAGQALAATRNHTSIEAEFAFCLMNPKARSFRESGTGCIKSTKAFTNMWPPDKTIPLDGCFDRTCTNKNGIRRTLPTKATMMTRHVLSCWSMLSKAYSRIALYGAGTHTRWLLEELLLHNAMLPTIIFDDACSCDQLGGIPVRSPDATADVEAVVVSSDAHAGAMTEKAENIWKDRIPVMNLYSWFPNPTFAKTTGACRSFGHQFLIAVNRRKDTEIHPAVETEDVFLPGPTSPAKKATAADIRDILNRHMDSTNTLALFASCKSPDEILTGLEQCAHYLFRDDRLRQAEELMKAVYELRFQDFMAAPTNKYVKRVNFQITSACNLKCKYCTFENNGKKKFMEPALFRKVLTELLEFSPTLEKLALYMSGESLLHPQLIDLLEIVTDVKSKQPGFACLTYVHTNGTLWTPELHKRIVDTGALTRVVWSIDGVDKQTFEAMRPKAKYDCVLDNFEYFLEHRPDGLEAWVNNLCDASCEGRKRDPRLQVLFSRADRVISSPPKDLNQSGLSHKKYEGRPDGFCDYVFNTVIVTVDGRMSLCCVDYNTENAFGNLNDHSFQEVYFGEERRRMLSKMHDHRRREIRGCRNCSLFHCNWTEDCSSLPAIPAPSALKNILKERWDRLKSVYGLKTVAVFGAGQHTVWLDRVLQNTSGPDVAAVLDDLPKDLRLFGQVVPRFAEGFDIRLVDALVLSSDCWQKQMTARCYQLYGNNLPMLVDLYEGLPKGPYDKSSV